MLLADLTEGNNSIEVYYHIFNDKILESFVHHGSKFRGGICHIKVHYAAKKGSIAGAEGRFVFAPAATRT